MGKFFLDPFQQGSEFFIGEGHRIAVSKNSRLDLITTVQVQAPPGIRVEDPRRILLMDASQERREIVFPFSVASGVPMGEQEILVTSEVQGIPMRDWRVLASKPFPWLLSSYEGSSSSLEGTWRPLPASVLQADGSLLLEEVLEARISAVAHLRTEFLSPSSHRSLLRIGTAGKATVWLNGDQVLATTVDPGPHREETGEVRLVKGRNELRVTCSPAEGDGRVLLRLTDADGSPLALWRPVPAPRN